jgi:hypothetical protein
VLLAGQALGWRVAASDVHAAGPDASANTDTPHRHALQDLSQGALLPGLRNLEEDGPGIEGRALGGRQSVGTCTNQTRAEQNASRTNFVHGYVALGVVLLGAPAEVECGGSWEGRLGESLEVVVADLPIVSERIAGWRRTHEGQLDGLLGGLDRMVGGEGPGFVDQLDGVRQVHRRDARLTCFSSTVLA